MQADRMRALLEQVFERTRRLAVGLGIGRSGGPGEASAEMGVARLMTLVGGLLSERSQSTGVDLATRVLAAYGALDAAGKAAFLVRLSTDFGPDPDAIEQAWRGYCQSPSVNALRLVTGAAEPPRQEILRRLNHAPFATGALVSMRADLLRIMPDNPDLRALEDDLVHLLRSWFNRGFLVMRRIDWGSPADLLERIIHYEAVHSIGTWDELRDRLRPQDRRCYGFFHPAMADEPLIFVEVALTEGIPDSIQSLLAPDRKSLSVGQARTAVFYSISNCQAGLAGISFGNFLIKQVVEDLSHELPGLDTFVTLSPVSGFMRWLRQQADAGDLAASASLADQESLSGLPAGDARAKARLALAARYYLDTDDGRGRPVDPVARFHLGNGARLERLCWLGDTSPKGMAQAGGLMVNYLYDLDTVEANHAAYARNGTVAASAAMRELLVPSAPPRRERLTA